MPAQHSHRLPSSILILGALGLGLHAGTALLRLGAFFPFPQQLDFASYYYGAWALRLGFSPYTFTPELARFLAQGYGLSLPYVSPTPPPAWLMLFLPFTLLPFPLAAWLWLGLNLALLGVCAAWLSDLAGVKGRAERAAVFLLALTFGPVFLDLTLGQSGTLALLAALLLGRVLSGRGPHWLEVAPASLVAAGKSFPALWLVGLVRLGRWRLVALLLALTALWLGTQWAVAPEASMEYWGDFLPSRAAEFAGAVSADDQSLPAWVQRVLLPQRFEVSGLDPSERQVVEWDPPWDVPRWLAQRLGFGLVGLVGVWLWRRTRPALSAHSQSNQVVIIFFAWVLFSLLLLPHTERYNHTLLLPGLALLWGQGGRGRGLAVVGYFLAGLSRLNHLWLLALPGVLGPLATGFGVLAVGVILVGLATGKMVVDGGGE
jgi:hypothetical protein